MSQHPVMSRAKGKRSIAKLSRQPAMSRAKPKMSIAKTGRSRNVA